MIWKYRKFSFPFFISKKNDERILQEDILKNIYNLEQEKSLCQTDSLSKKLGEDKNRVENSLSELEKSKLVEIYDNKIKLTDSGKLYALRIIRFHRLYEKYLADKTNIDERIWHKVADEVEHKLTNEEAEKLAAQIGNPVFDPHGDPIPSSVGEIPEVHSIPLTQLNYSDVYVVTHIEDEPNEIYQRIISKGIYKGTQIRFLGIFNNEVSLYANEKLLSIPIEEAKNISVGLPKLEKIHFGEFHKLSSLNIGERGKVVGIAKSVRGQQRRRLMDLGIVPGTIIEAELESLLGDPVAYRVRGTSIALRKNQTDKIYIEKI